jgi:hypothetical protein
VSDYDDLQQRYAGVAAEDLKPIIEDAATLLGVDTPSTVEQLGVLFARAWMAGAQAGQDEMVDQAAEGGLIIERVVLKPPS